MCVDHFYTTTRSADPRRKNWLIFHCLLREARFLLTNSDLVKDPSSASKEEDAMTNSLHFRNVALPVVFGLICGVNAAQAGVITSITAVEMPGLSTGGIGPAGATPSPNNDNASAASPNTVPYSVVFNGALGPLLAEFATDASGGTTEYRFTQTFVNNTGQVWTGFVFELGYGLSGGFTLSGATDGLDFDWPDADPTPTASLFSILSHQSDRIEWSGGSIPSAGALTLTFAIDVPDNLAAFNPGQVNRFTLRQTPIASTQSVPEPSSLLLLAAGLLGWISWRRRVRWAGLDSNQGPRDYESPALTG